MIGKDVLYNGERLILTRFWANNELCLWICNPKQISIPKMKFVGGCADEYCIFIKDLTKNELQSITFLDGSPINFNEFDEID